MKLFLFFPQVHIDANIRKEMVHYYYRMKELRNHDGINRIYHTA